jgi:hypothetical protein
MSSTTKLTVQFEAPKDDELEKILQQVVPDTFTHKEDTPDPPPEVVNVQPENTGPASSAKRSTQNTQKMVRPVKPPSLDSLLKSGKEVSFFVMKSVEVGTPTFLTHPTRWQTYR